MAVGFPIALVLLTELQNALRRRNSVLARPVHLLRTYILPLGALLFLLVGAMQVSGEATPVRIVATVFGFVVLVLLLSGLNATLFQGAPEGTWRKRIPSIFLDVARFALIAVGLALILAYIWGANVGGLFTALGISSIVLGLRCRTRSARSSRASSCCSSSRSSSATGSRRRRHAGRVVEVNWRATHIDTGSGLQIMPNSVLAAASFTNFSSRPAATRSRVATVFSVDDPPDDVRRMLNRVAASLPQLRPDAAPSSCCRRRVKYTTSIPVRTPADDFARQSRRSLRWVWYASRRAGLHLDEAEDEFATR